MINTLEQEIKQLIKVIGTEHSVFKPTAYATAWVSRVPAFNNLAEPAYPEALSWLRTHQFPDGSWGSANPINPYANTLSTLASLLALMHWNKAEDQVRISKAIHALDSLAQQLGQEGIKTFGFELILAALIEEVKVKRIALSEQTFVLYQPFLQMGDMQREMLKGYFKQTNYQNPNIFWLCLEMLGGHLLTDVQQEWPFPADVLADNGSLLASVAASAYFLAANRYRQRDLPATTAYLNKLVQENAGGVPPYHPMEDYELAFSLDFLLKAGVPAAWLQPAIEQLKRHWDLRNGLGYSPYSPSLDADDTAIGLFIFKKANIEVSHHLLLQFFNNEYFSHHVEDPSPSVSVNANVLRALNLCKTHSDVQPLIDKTLLWIKSQFNNAQDKVFHDTWHISPYYAASAIIFALTELDRKLNQYCIDWLIAQQRHDGGWGYKDGSTLEETSLAVLALTYAHRSGYEIEKKIFICAKEYLDKTMRQPVHENAFYMGTTMVYPAQVVKATLLAAQYALGSLSLQ